MTDDVVASTRDTYDRVAVDYDRRTREPDAAFAAFRTAFAAATASDEPVVDLGCGPGRDVAALRLEGVRAFGVDLSSGMLALAHGRGVPVVRGDLRRPPLRPGSVGAVWSSAALLHVPRAEVPATLRTWHGLLRPGGRLGLSTSLGGDEGWEVVPYAGEGPAGGELHRWFVHHDEAGLVAQLGEAGFTVVQAERRQSNRSWLMVQAVA
jgi:SAM-dependent methyltransferase